MFDVRQELVKYAQLYGIKPAAKRFGCSKNTVRTWKRRYEAKGSTGLQDLRKGPHHIPHKTSLALEQQIINCREQVPCYGPKRLRWSFGLTVSEGAIARILRAKHLTRTRRKKYQRKQDLRAVKAAKYSSLDHHQVDVKHLYDIPYYWEQLQRLGLPKYQYTIRDTKSGFLALGFSKEYSELHSTLFVERYLDHLNAYRLPHTIIQTDNGTEFGGGKKHVNKAGFVNTIVCKRGSRHQYIPPGLSNANADVESIHATIEQEFFDLERFKDRADFFQKSYAYQLFYNLVRPNFSKSGKPPAQILFEDKKSLDSRILFLPVIDLDQELNTKIPDNYVSLSGGQSLPKLPDFLL